jgi:L-glutamine:2-deoxy-scyllo-inosose/3-amino-2,3-dideoxy-scyllo-inosose aminotransferase
MTTTHSTNSTRSRLALAGGEPLAPVGSLVPPPWPPLSATAESALLDVYRSRKWSFCGSREVAFARDFAAAHDAEHAVFMANGTVTLQSALIALGIGPGDEVIVPALTWPATAMAVIYTGAVPVFADIEADSLCLDPQAFETAITPRTRAVIPVHLYGGMADLEQILRIAKRHNLKVIEDCAHAHGGKWPDRGVGSWGDIGSFSFQESKTMSSGEGGACLTNDRELAERLYRIKHIGYGDGAQQGAFQSRPPEGLTCHNFRATEFQAALLQDQLEGLDALMERYNSNAARLEARFTGVEGLRVQARGRLGTRQSYYAFCVICDQGPLAQVPLPVILNALRAEGLGAGPTYGVVYRHLLFNAPGDSWRLAEGGCQVAETVGADRVVTLIHQWLGADTATIDAIGDVFCKVAAGADELRGLESA